MPPNEPKPVAQVVVNPNQPGAQPNLRPNGKRDVPPLAERR